MAEEAGSLLLGQSTGIQATVSSIIHDHVDGFRKSSHKYDTYPASFNFHCLQYAWPALQLFKSLV